MCSSQIPTYIYEPLAPDRFETHIVTLYPGQYDDEICIALDTVTIPAPTGWEYEALSYTWGSSDLTHSIRVVSNPNSEGVLPITLNLDTMLRHLRYKDHPRRLWVDAISINQADVAEKSHQVQWMGRVYSHARRVVIFLGPSTDNDLHALEALETIGKNVNIGGFNFHTIVKIQEPNPPDILEHDGDRVHKLRIARPLTEAILALFQRPWFSRLWIIQEVRLMSDPALGILQCGHQTLSWDHFRKGAFCFRELELSLDSCQNLKMKVDSRLMQISRVLFKVNEKPSFFSYGSLRWFECEDPRDRLYGTLSLTAVPMAHIKVDYTRTVADVFEEVQRYEIEKRGLWLLQYCYIDRDKDWTAPSWVPNQLSFPSYIQEMRAIPTFRFFHQCEFVGDKSLKVHGGAMATVQTILDIPPLPTEQSTAEEPERMFDWLQLVWSRIHQATRLGKREDGNEDNRRAKKLLQLCDILMSKTYDEANVNKIGLYSRRHVKAMLAGVFSENRVEPPDWSSPKLSHFMVYLSRRLRPVLSYTSSPAIFTTDTDDLGYGPASALPGDKVCAIFGCFRAMLLRPVANVTSAEYVVVGPTCLAGGQRSEAVLGPLPGYVFLTFDTPNSRNAFRDTRTGEMVPDPRMKRFGLHDTAVGFTDSMISKGDIDLPITELSERGIPVETFILI